MPDDDADEYHGTLHIEQNEHDQFTMAFDFIAGIGLYKLAMGIDDEDSQQVSAALQVQLAEMVGP